MDALDGSRETCARVSQPSVTEQPLRRTMAQYQTSPWTSEKTERLKTLWAAGVSAAAIEDEFGAPFTRSSIIGKVHRLGLKKRRTIRSRGKTRKAPPKTLSKRLQLRLELAQVIEPTCEPVGLLNLESHHCRYVLGEPSEMLFCGAPKFSGSYCAKHHQIVYREPNTHGELERLRRHYTMMRAINKSKTNQGLGIVVSPDMEDAA